MLLFFDTVSAYGETKVWCADGALLRAQCSSSPSERCELTMSILSRCTLILCNDIP